MRGQWIVLGVVALLGVSACGGGTSRAPLAPSTAITATVGAGTPSANPGASSVSWPCFTRAGVGGTFGASGCPAVPVTTSRFLPAAGSPVAAPSAPTGLSATVSGSTVALDWTAPVGGDAPTSYVVQAGSAIGLTDIASFNTGGIATSLAVLGVPAGTYFVRVRAANSAGTSGPSNEVQVVVTGVVVCGSLSAPGGVAASVTGNTVALTWSTPPGCAPTNYIIQVGSAPGLSNLSNFSTGSTGTTFTATGVASGTYYLRILSAAGAVQSAPSTEITFAVGGCGTTPNAPTNLRATVSGSTVALAWDPPAGSCAPTSYLLQAGSTSGASNVANTPVTGTSLAAAGVANGTYYIRVLAVNAVGQSLASNEIVVVVGAVVTPPTIFASFQLFDPATQGSPTTECRIRSAATPAQKSTCTLLSTSFTTGANAIVSSAWTVMYTYDEVKTIQQSGSSPTLSFSDLCGLPTSTDDGVAQALSVTLTVTDNLGAAATATSGVGSQSPLLVRLFTCGF